MSPRSVFPYSISIIATRTLFFLFPFSFFLAAATAARGDAGWILTTADLKNQPVSFASIDSLGVKIIPFGGSATPAAIPFDSFLQIERTGGQAQLKGKYTLHLAGGDKLLGEPVSFKDEQVIWKNAIAGELKFPLKEVRALVRTGKSPDNLDGMRAEDVVQMGNGDSVKGIVTDMSDVKLKVNSNAADVELNLETVDWILFATTSKPALPQRAFRVHLSDGSRLTAAKVEADAANLTLFPANSEKRAVGLALINGVEQLSGPLSWLSLHTPKTSVQIPFTAAQPRPARMDLSVEGKPIVFGGRTFQHGIGVHSYSRLEFALDGTWRAFQTQYAISADERRPFADVTVRIKLDGKVVHEAKGFKAETLAAPVLIDLPAAPAVLTLEVDYGAVMDSQDSFNWIEPALLRKKPAEQPTTRP